MQYVQVLQKRIELKKEFFFFNSTREQQLKMP